VIYLFYLLIFVELGESEGEGSVLSDSYLVGGLQMKSYRKRFCRDAIVVVFFTSV